MIKKSLALQTMSTHIKKNKKVMSLGKGVFNEEQLLLFQ